MGLPGLFEKFTAAGGDFVTPVEDLKKKVAVCRAVVFDWDGVFNAGRKGHTSSSGFSEADSMGMNMLRYGLWRRLGELPYAAIISGEDNESAIAFARREHLTAAYTGIRDKRQVIAHLCDNHKLQPGQIACVFDDINDLSMAKVCGLRFRVRRQASPMFADFADRREFCDYVTGANSGSYAVREVCELLLGLMDSYTDVVESRIACDDAYEEYFGARQSVITDCYGQRDDVIEKL
ncbi:MAG: phosphatase [Proteobacteria bacterium]|nr:phosphatase [Pseudomonadota bacterium]TDJ32020.1 MAG: phosphatase [Gammaproteobacteria bacterium]